MCAVAVAAGEVEQVEAEIERRGREGPHGHDQEKREDLRAIALAAWIVVGKRGSRGSGDTANAGVDQREDRSHV